jgi:hypothetical protein
MKTFQGRREENLCNQMIVQEFGLKGGYLNNPEYTYTHTHTQMHTTHVHTTHAHARTGMFLDTETGHINHDYSVCSEGCRLHRVTFWVFCQALGPLGGHINPEEREPFSI